MKKVELLAPAGNFDALKGVIKAGADAIYLGGTLYSARAYADNFTQEEICEGIHLAHVFGRKVYLTVNTLVKEKELDYLYQYMLPFYEKGLDGVIVQDLGVLRFLRAYFPALPLHASTQMTITGSRGAALIKAEGVSRVVPARELSLEEIKKLKQETGLEIETFIHGAMCYCYSGQCLTSSMLGGRSGNRGRCAQPCRLPYEIKGKRGYPLSMRDMCTIALLPKLIRAGIDSFKIEGRMKKPAYAAGVTAIYRKYIDLYDKEKENYKVSREDMDVLNSLYIRSKIGDGYYKRQNGREMIGFDSPAYRETDEGLLGELENRYIKGELSREVRAKVYLMPQEPAKLTLEKGHKSVTVTGDMVQKACKQPLTTEQIERQMKKSGDSPLRAGQVEVEAGEVFLPISSLNELRRKALAAMEDAIICQYGLAYKERKAAAFKEPLRTKADGEQTRAKGIGVKEKELHAYVRTFGQLEAALEGGIRRIYLDYSLLELSDEKGGGLLDKLTAAKADDHNFGWINAEGKEVAYKELACGESAYQEPVCGEEVCGEPAFYLATPYIVREKDIKYLKKMENAFKSGLFEGILIRNLEGFQFFAGLLSPGQIVIDANLYIWNREAAAFWENRAEEFYLPIELNGREWRELLASCQGCKMQASAIVYGRLPMMITANCVKKTTESCNKTPEILLLKDRYHKQLPVYTDCLSCYNIIYNSLPLSLHGLFRHKAVPNPAKNLRLDFTTEEKQEALQVISYFKGLFVREEEPFYREYTTGHYKRGVD